MTKKRSDPLREMLQLRERVNHLFEEVLHRTAGAEGRPELVSAGWKPPVDLVETEDGYVFRADLPGVPADGIEVRIEQGVLHIAGSREADSGRSPDAFLRVERPQGRFVLELSLPPSVDPSGIRASNRNGVLEIRLPRLAADRERASIQVDVRG